MVLTYGPTIKTLYLQYTRRGSCHNIWRNFRSRKSQTVLGWAVDAIRGLFFPTAIGFVFGHQEDAPAQIICVKHGRGRRSASRTFIQTRKMVSLKWGQAVRASKRFSGTSPDSQRRAEDRRSQSRTGTCKSLAIDSILLASLSPVDPDKSGFRMTAVK